MWHYGISAYSGKQRICSTVRGIRRDYSALICVKRFVVLIARIVVYDDSCGVQKGCTEERLAAGGITNTSCTNTLDVCRREGGVLLSSDCSLFDQVI